MDIVEKIKYLAKKNGTDMANIEKNLGLGNSSIRRWSTNSPSCNKVLKVANYLSVPIDWLVNDSLDILDLKKENLPLSYNLKSLLEKATPEDLHKIECFLEIATMTPLSVSNIGNENLIYNFIPNTYSFVAEESTYNAGLQKLLVRGYIAAGTPIEAIDNALSTIEVSSNIDADYALIVSGNSMHPVIEDGEYVYVKSVEELNNNDIGVFYYNGSVTCKKFFKNDVMIKLISINPTYEDFVFRLDDAKNENINFKIEGKVILSAEQRKRLNK